MCIVLLVFFVLTFKAFFLVLLVLLVIFCIFFLEHFLILYNSLLTFFVLFSYKGSNSIGFLVYLSCNHY